MTADMASRLQHLRDRMAQACERAKRPLHDVRLLAVSKLQPIEAIQEAYELGLREFGENYIQEYIDKASALPKDIRWHVIGPVQSNKARFIAEHPPAMLQTIDRSSIIEALESRMAKLHAGKHGATPRLPVLIEVQLAPEASKSGIAPEQLPAILARLDESSFLQAQGLMSIPPFIEAEALRPFHQRLASLLKELNSRRQHPLQQLSMGMSADFEVAIEEGATIVRVGTALFGPRR
ncbi:MAG: YggS family pyridoxal phosphate-dependent enzyme [Myxococcota bacterium]|nr:YggS family pyridoxal phosphate-dependent enzyme [Myxococcota bacterium]